MTDAHRLTPEDVAVLRRRTSRGWAGTVTFVVTLAVTCYAAASATETWLTGWASAIAYLGIGLGLGALALAYVAPRSAAVCGLVWSLYLIGCAMAPGASGIIAAGPRSAAVAGTCAIVLALVPGYGLLVGAQQRALLRSWAPPDNSLQVPAADDMLRSDLRRPRVGRVVIGSLLAVATLVFLGGAWYDTTDSIASLAHAQVATTTVERTDDSSTSWVVIDGREYGLFTNSDNPGDTVRVRYDPTTGYAEDADDPYDPGGGGMMAGLLAPFCLWLLGTEVAHRRSVRQLLTVGGTALWALATHERHGRIRLGSEEDGSCLGTWDAMHGDPRLAQVPLAETFRSTRRQPFPVLVVACDPHLDVVVIRPAQEDSVWMAGRRRRIGNGSPMPRPSLVSSPALAGQVPDSLLHEEMSLPEPIDAGLPGQESVTTAESRDRRWRSSFFLGSISMVLAALTVRFADPVLLAQFASWFYMACVLPLQRLPRLVPREDGLTVHGPVLTRTIPWNLVADITARGEQILLTLWSDTSSATPRTRIVKAPRRGRPIATGCRTAAAAAQLVERSRPPAVLFVRQPTTRLSQPAVDGLLLLGAITAGALIGNALTPA